ncbi:MAG TPA: XRE family transcriptional regulator [Pyrinomonadaceae bacterium]|jgi:Zn-dependent peptidase ImmA (M78 family)/transcriptional regulator with XRE-family HTH domain
MNGNRLKRAREIKGLTQAEIADAVGVTQAAIARIEQNLLEPSEQTVQQIALRTGFPVSFFYQESKVDFPLGSLLFRKHSALKSKDRAQIIQTAWAAYLIFDFMAEKLRMMPVRLPRVEKEEPIIAAQLTRNALGVESDTPIKNLINKLEKCGVVVINLKLEVNEHDAFSLWVDNKRPVIVFTNGKSGDRLRRNGAHETGHLVCHSAMSGSRDDVEKEADKFANELLLPEEAMRHELTAPVTLSSIAELKARWGVSMQSIVERAFELEIISANQRKYLWQQISRQNWRKKEPVDIGVENPRALQKMAELLYADKSGKVNYTKLAKDISLPISLVLDTFSGYVGNTIDMGNQSNVIQMFPPQTTEDKDNSSLKKTS